MFLMSLDEVRPRIPSLASTKKAFSERSLAIARRWSARAAWVVYDSEASVIVELYSLNMFSYKASGPPASEMNLEAVRSLFLRIN